MKKSNINYPVNKSRDADSWFHSSIPMLSSSLNTLIKNKKNEPVRIQNSFYLLLSLNWQQLSGPFKRGGK